jgi:hypothetical protein
MASHNQAPKTSRKARAIGPFRAVNKVLQVDPSTLKARTTQLTPKDSRRKIASPFLRDTSDIVSFHDFLSLGQISTEGFQVFQFISQQVQLEHRFFQFGNSLLRKFNRNSPPTFQLQSKRIHVGKEGTLFAEVVQL